MGKLTRLILSLVMIDLIFIITGQLGISSSLSLITSLITDPSSVTTSQFYNIFLGTAGVAALLTGVAVIVGVAITKSELLLFVPMAIALGAITGDFITLFNILKDYNLILASLIMTPIIGLYVMTVVEWLRGKD